jgi:hypothetical protein
MLLNLQNSLRKENACTILFGSLILFFLLVNIFPRCSQNSFKKQQIAAGRFSKEVCANPKIVSTNKKRGIALYCLQKSFVSSKAFGVSG